MKLQTATRSISMLILGISLASCSDSIVEPPPTTGVTVPPAYTFDSRFVTGTSSVDYGGQVVRNLLVQDLATAIRNLAKPGAAPATAADLLRYYEHSDASAMSTLTTAGTLPVAEARYSSISTGKKLSDKISSATVIGSGKTADALVREWLQTIADNSNDPAKLGTTSVYLDADGRDLAQLVAATLFGSVSYYQATGVYLQGILEKNNVVAAAGASGNSPFTQMEHYWDEAFGYFGAARDFARYTDADLSGAVAAYVHDSNGDGKIDLASEFNYPLARYAGKRDKDATGVDFSKDIFTAFLTGRATITAVGTTEAISAQRAIITSSWEKVMAANVIHYLNDVTDDMAALTAASTAANSNTLSSHWSEMKGYAMTLQYNPFKRLNDQQIATLHTLVGDAPVIAAPGSEASTAYLAKLAEARELLKSALGFSEANAAAW